MEMTLSWEEKTLLRLRSRFLPLTHYPLLRRTLLSASSAAHTPSLSHHAERQTSHARLRLRLFREWTRHRIESTSSPAVVVDSWSDPLRRHPGTSDSMHIGDDAEDTSSPFRTTYARDPYAVASDQKKPTTKRTRRRDKFDDDTDGEQSQSQSHSHSHSHSHSQRTKEEAVSSSTSSPWLRKGRDDEEEEEDKEDKEEEQRRDEKREGAEGAEREREERDFRLRTGAFKRIDSMDGDGNPLSMDWLEPDPRSSDASYLLDCADRWYQMRSCIFCTKQCAVHELQTLKVTINPSTFSIRTPDCEILPHARPFRHACRALFQDDQKNVGSALLHILSSIPLACTRCHLNVSTVNKRNRLVASHDAQLSSSSTPPSSVGFLAPLDEEPFESAEFLNCSPRRSSQLVALNDANLEIGLDPRSADVLTDQTIAFSFSTHSSISSHSDETPQTALLLSLRLVDLHPLLFRFFKDLICSCSM